MQDEHELAIEKAMNKLRKEIEEQHQKDMDKLRDEHKKDMDKLRDEIKGGTSSTYETAESTPTNEMAPSNTNEMRNRKQRGGDVVLNMLG